MLDQVAVTDQGVARIRRGHLWVYRSDVRGASGFPGGAVVRVVDTCGRHVGQALFSDRSQITLRFLSLGEEPIDADWWRARLREAAARRRELVARTNAYRLVHAEGDLLPGLIIDVYDGVYVLQALCQGIDRVQELLVELLQEEFEPRAILERNDARVREIEGLPRRAGIVRGTAPAEIEFVEHGVRMLAAPLEGQKTGAFLDQRENHLAAGRVAFGRALDAFCFRGGFALHLAANCQSVMGLDSSAEAVEAARRAALANRLTNVRFHEANVFDALRELEMAKEQFETIVLDPPAFAKNQASLPAATRGYKEINLRAMKLLAPGGILVSCSCSYHLSESLFLEILSDAARDAARRVQLLQRRTQAVDHPALLGVPETAYLKCFIARLL